MRLLFGNLLNRRVNPSGGSLGVTEYPAAETWIQLFANVGLRLSIVWLITSAPILSEKIAHFSDNSNFTKSIRPPTDFRF
jgi:hypothetical protein